MKSQLTELHHMGVAGDRPVWSIPVMLPDMHERHGEQDSTQTIYIQLKGQLRGGKVHTYVVINV